LLDTIRSRTQLVRFAPLSAVILAQILARREVPAARIASAVELANGSASAALLAADEEASKARDAFVASMLDAIAAPDLSLAISIAKEQEKDRDELTARLTALATRLASESKASLASNDGREAIHAARFGEVQRALRELDRNASLALVIESLVQRLRSVA
jgi:DNA polymerase-3 subunit delta'